MSFVRKIDLRYVGQSFELTIPAGDDLLERFHAEHDRTYGFSAPEEPVEVVSLRLTSVGTIAKPPPRPLEAGGEGRAEGAPARLLRRVGRLRRLPDLRPLRPAGRRDLRRPGDRRGVRLDHRSSIQATSLLVDETGNLLIERGAA